MASKRRRELISGSAAALGAALLGAPLPSGAQQGTGRAGPRRLKLLVAGAHPDDPESIAGGTILRYTDAGHEVVCLYLTRGEAGIPGKTHAEAAAVRTDEALRACSLLKARVRLVGQVDGATEVGVGRYAETRRIFDEERPDLVITHWPIDTHRDHRAMALLAYDAWLAEPPVRAVLRRGHDRGADPGLRPQPLRGHHRGRAPEARGLLRPREPESRRVLRPPRDDAPLPRTGSRVRAGRGLRPPAFARFGCLSGLTVLVQVRFVGKER